MQFTFFIDLLDRFAIDGAGRGKNEADSLRFRRFGKRTRRLEVDLSGQRGIQFRRGIVGNGGEVNDTMHAVQDTAAFARVLAKSPDVFTNNLDAWSH